MSNKYEVNIQGMTCDMCIDHVVKGLSSAESVETVRIDSWKKGKAIITSKNGSVITKKDLKQSLINTSYKVKKFQEYENSKSEFNEPETNVDLAIIGTGGAGMAAAIQATSMGRNVTIIERNEIVGGTCVNIGCIPSKALIKAANHNYKAVGHQFTGITLTSEKVDWPTLVENRNTLVETLRREKYENVLKRNPQIKLVKAEAKFERNKGGFPVLKLDNNETVLAKRYLISTGSRNRTPEVKGIDEVDLLDSTSALILTKKPETMIVLGGGFIALEIGQAFSRLGVYVKSIEVRSRLLSKWDTDISQAITNSLREEGIPVNEGSTPVEFFNRGSQKGVKLQDSKGNITELIADEILIAMGRQANSDSLGLENLNVEVLQADGSIVVDEFMQTSHHQIYAAGDVANVSKLVYVAAKTGKVASSAAFGDSEPFDSSIVPEVVFCDPQIARVGLMAEEAKQKGINAKTTKLDLKHVPKALVSNNANGFIKLIADVDKNILIGAHIISENAGDLIQTASMAMAMGKKYGFSIDDFKSMLFPYLTEVEGLKLAAQTFTVDVASLSCCAG